MKGKIKNAFILIIVIQPFLYGCNGQNFEKPAIEDYGLVGVMGFDQEKGSEKTKVTLALPQPSPAAEESVQIYEESAKEPFDALLAITRESEKVLDFSQLRVVLFSEAYAREVGLMHAMERLYRDPNIGAKVFIAVVKGDAGELIKGDYKSKTDVTIFLNELLHPKITSAFSPFTTIHDFVFDVTSNTSDPIVPYLEKKGEIVEVSKISLFKNEKLIDTIEPEQAKFLQALRKVKRLPSMGFYIKERKQKEDSYVALDLIEAKSKMKVNEDLEEPMVDIQLNIKGMLLKYTGSNTLHSARDKKKLEKVIEEKLKKETVKMVNTLQEKRVDPLRISEKFRSKNTRDWSEERWNDVYYPKLDYKVHVKVDITTTGTIE